MPPILVAHAALLAWVASDHPSNAIPTTRNDLVVIDIPAARPAPQPSYRPIKTKVSPLPVPAKLPTEASMTVMIAASPSEPDLEPLIPGSCDLTDTVQIAIRDNPEALRALLALPQKARSVANAVMLWNRNWIAEPTPDSQGPLLQVRDIIQAIVINASPECRQATQAGPRLITVAGPPDMVLAIGSGRWRWGDLTSQDIQVASADVRTLPKSDTSGLAEPQHPFR